ncbi:MAG: DEAD/DEAH box helicase family protein [Prevotellaceae bacterium]|nr:DEAD/DEAH box helicase family protein [Candidatus Faecinaster equi]
MITLPKYIIKEVHSVGKNVVRRCYGQEEIVLDNNNDAIIKSRNPLFIVEQDGKRIAITSKPSEVIPEDCPYAVLVQKIPTKVLFQNDELIYKGWLKHPKINEGLAPDAIAQSWRGKFTFIEEDKDSGLFGLRQPQAGAIHAWLSSRNTRKDRATIVMPTGTGKTETMLGIMVAAQCKKVLVAVPHDALREQIGYKFLTLGKLHGLGIITSDCKYPYVTIINNGMDNIHDWQTIIERSNVIVTTMSILAQTSNDVRKLLSRTISNVFVDEAHHSEAPTWSQFLDNFDRTHITQYTATPFRNDGRKLKGEFIYTFSLRNAQQQGYYQKINFNPVYVIDKDNADKEIAKKAVEILRHDIEIGKDHILMARCKDTVRAEEVFACYKEYADLQPVLIHSKTPNKSHILDEIKNKQHKIIVCVNMLGEGFDLPQLKVAAIHDEKQSLPITLQFIGRFTRTEDDSIGEASFVTNMAYPPMADDIRELYLKDADWNYIIPGLNDKSTQEQKDFADLLNQFPDLNQSEIPFQSINPALSTVIYRLNTFDWQTDKWENIYTEKEYDYRYASVNDDDDMMIIILGSIEKVDWTNYEGIQNRMWDVILLHKYDAGSYKHLYINSSLGRPAFEKLVEALFGRKQYKIEGDVVFRSFHGINRLLVQIFGGRKVIPGDVSYKSYVGRDVENGLNELSQRRLKQNNIFASGIYKGESITHGCSKSGKIWSYRRGNLLSFKKWSHRIGGLVEDPTISTQEIFKYTLCVNPVATPPNSVPISVDWDDDIYKNAAYEQFLQIDGYKDNIYIFDASIELTERKYNIDNLPTDILFQISFRDFCTKYKITYQCVVNGEYKDYSYKVEKVSGPDVKISGRNIPNCNILDYFNSENRSPVFFFANGAMLYANNLVQLRDELIVPYKVELLKEYDWAAAGVDIHVESMDLPHKQNSIQYYMWQKIKDDFELVFDDDGSGEIADLIGVKTDADTIYVHLFHLKFAIDSCTSRKIDNFYAVCGQAEKSLKWRNGNMHIFKQMIKRAETTTKADKRILKGDKNLLQIYDQESSITKKVSFHLHIVQPGLSKADTTEDIMHLLGVVQNYAYEVCNAGLTVHCNK